MALWTPSAIHASYGKVLTGTNLACNLEIGFQAHYNGQEFLFPHFELQLQQRLLTDKHEAQGTDAQVVDLLEEDLAVCIVARKEDRCWRSEIAANAKVLDAIEQEHVQSEVLDVDGFDQHKLAAAAAGQPPQIPDISVNHRILGIVRACIACLDAQADDQSSVWIHLSVVPPIYLAGIDGLQAMMTLGLQSRTPHHPDLPQLLYTSVECSPWCVCHTHTAAYPYKSPATSLQKTK